MMFAQLTSWSASRMTGASKLFGSVLAHRLPPRVLVYEFLNRLNRWFGTGNTRFHFERLYLEHADPWNYRTSAYEHAKYERTLARILETRSGSERALEIGCSIGIFTRSLAQHFRTVVASDISGEALRRAADYCCENRNISFLRSQIQALTVAGTFDVIVCAEMLYYIEDEHASAVCRQLKRYLRPGGLIVIVTGSADGDVWQANLASHFNPAFKELVPDSIRAYQIIIFQNRPSS